MCLGEGGALVRLGFSLSVEGRLGMVNSLIHLFTDALN